jgi:phenylpyruvate tautomerase PptA (4-oxalocrotonate tautomerase family)
MINVTMTKGSLTKQQRADLTEKLTRQLLKIEGVDNEASRSIAWVLFHEVEPGGWAVGGKFDDTYVPEGGRFLTVVSVPSGGLHARGKKDDIAKSVHAAFPGQVLVRNHFLSLESVYAGQDGRRRILRSSTT